MTQAADVLTPNHVQTHWESILVLYRQRRALMALPDVDASLLARNESFLRYHLHVLARCAGFEAQAQKEAQAFALAALRLSSPDEDVRRRGYEMAHAMLVDGGEAGAGAFAALALMPAGAGQGLMDLYHRYERLRPRLFALWREQGWEVPRGLLNRAELQGRDEALQEAALTYAAHSPAVGVDLFQGYCRTLLDGGSTKTTGSVLVPALWGAMLRGAPEIGRMLRRAVERETDPFLRCALLRLAALRADADLLPVLRQLLNERPAQGARLLALHGTAEAVDLLLEALDQVKTMEAAAAVWPWVSGCVLAQKPRLQVVGGEEGQGLMPDAEAARVWWALQKKTLNDGDRLVFGAPADIDRLQALADQKAGRAGEDLLDLLALKLGSPLDVTATAEQARRRVVLQSLRCTRGEKG